MSVLMAEISWVEYERRLREEDAIVLVPVGAVEQHGPHMPLGTDAILAGEMSRRAAARVGGMAMASKRPIAAPASSKLTCRMTERRCGGVEAVSGMAIIVLLSV